MNELAQIVKKVLTRISEFVTLRKCKKFGKVVVEEVNRIKFCKFETILTVAESLRSFRVSTYLSIWPRVHMPRVRVFLYDVPILPYVVKVLQCP
jgi:hypothetical protein